MIYLTGRLDTGIKALPLDEKRDLKFLDLLKKWVRYVDVNLKNSGNGHNLKARNIYNFEAISPFLPKTHPLLPDQLTNEA